MKPFVNLQADVRVAASNLQHCREGAEIWEKHLQVAVAAIVNAHRGGLRDWARSVGISAQYACDIAHGRRKISDAIVRKVLGK